jgi:hypothetical protein
MSCSRTTLNSFSSFLGSSPTLLASYITLLSSYIILNDANNSSTFLCLPPRKPSSHSSVSVVSFVTSSASLPTLSNSSGSVPPLPPKPPSEAFIFSILTQSYSPSCSKLSIPIFAGRFTNWNLTHYLFHHQNLRGFHTPGPHQAHL